MLKKLKVDRNFTPCVIADGDEYFANGIFVFNVSKMRTFISNNLDLITLEQIAVNTFFETSSSLDEYHLENLQIFEPIIMAEIAPGNYNLIDGHHRVERAKRLGMDNLHVYKLTVDQHIEFLTDKRAYLAYIAYWNDKLEEVKTRSV